MPRITRALATFVIAGWLGLALPHSARAQTIVAWGNNQNGQCNVPALPPGSYVEVFRVAAWRVGATAPLSRGGPTPLASATSWRCRPGSPTSRSRRARYHTVARRSDGSVIAFGSNTNGQCNVPALPAGLTYVEIAAGAYHTVARRSDGSVVAWGLNGDGECNVPPLPAGLTYVECRGSASPRVTRWRAGATVPSSRGDTTDTASATCRRCLAESRTSRSPRACRTRWLAGATAPSLRGADNQFGQCNIPAPPPGLTYIGVAAGGGYTAALQGLAGAAVSVGAGCGGAGVPSLGCNAPRIGQNLIFALTQGTPNASGSLFFSGVPAAPTILGFGCAVELDLAAFNAFTPVVAGPAGGWGATVGRSDG